MVGEWEAKEYTSPCSDDYKPCLPSFVLQRVTTPGNSRTHLSATHRHHCRRCCCHTILHARQRRVLRHHFRTSRLFYAWGVKGLVASSCEPSGCGDKFSSTATPHRRATHPKCIFQCGKFYAKSLECVLIYVLASPKTKASVKLLWEEGGTEEREKKSQRKLLLSTCLHLILCYKYIQSHNFT